MGREIWREASTHTQVPKKVTSCFKKFQWGIRRSLNWIYKILRSEAWWSSGKLTAGEEIDNFAPCLRSCGRKHRHVPTIYEVVDLSVWPRRGWLMPSYAFFFFFVANFLYILISIMSSSFRRSLGAICRTFFVGCCVLISPFIYFIYFFNFISTLNTSHPHRIKILSGCFQSKKNPSFYTEDRIVISQGSSCIRSTQGCVVPWNWIPSSVPPSFIYIFLLFILASSFAIRKKERKNIYKIRSMIC
jgi:hypothetical protein